MYNWSEAQAECVAKESALVIQENGDSEFIDIQSIVRLFISRIGTNLHVWSNNCSQTNKNCDGWGFSKDSPASDTRVTDRPAKRRDTSDIVLCIQG